MERTRRGRPISFLTVTPYWLTEVGRFGLAWDTRFWVFTWSMSTLVPTSKVTLRFMVPSLAFVDIMYSMLRSEEHTSELQSRGHLVCRLLLEKKKKTRIRISHSL